MNAFIGEQTKAITPVCVNVQAFSRSIELETAKDVLIKRIETGDLANGKLSPAELNLTLFMFFTAVSSLICNPVILTAIFERAISSTQELYENGERFHIDINQKLEGMGSNSNDGEKRTTLHRCYLESLALSSLHRLLTGKKCTDIESNEEKLLSLLNALLLTCNCHPFKTVKLFCSAAVEMQRRTDGVSIPIFLAEFATGNNPAHAVPLVSLHALHNQLTKAEFTIRTLEHIPQGNKCSEIITKRVLNSGDSEEINIDDLCLRLRGMLKVNRDAHQPTEVKKLIEYLEHRLSQLTSLPFSAILLLSWFIHSLREKKWIHAETPRKYLNTIGRSWLKFTTNIDLSLLDGAEMDVLCQAIIEDNYVSSDAPYRLRDLIQYTVSHFDINAPDDPFYTVSDCNKYVQTTIIPDHVIRQVGCELRRSNDHRCKHFRDTMNAMYLVLSRLGLRPTEVTRLYIKDIEVSQDGWVFVRPHMGFRLKNLQSKRKVPSVALFKPDEAKAFQSFVAYRRQQLGETSDHYLFSVTEFTNQAFTTADLEEHIGSLVSQYMRTHVPVYQFRHTCATNLILIVFGSDKLIEQYTPYNTEQARNIKLAIIGKVRRDKLWAIAHFMGHQTPRVTLFSYAHSLDLLLHERLSQVPQRYTPQFWLNLSGLPARAIKELSIKAISDSHNKDGTLSVTDIYPLLARKMRKFTSNASVTDRRKPQDEVIAQSTVSPDMIQCFNVLQKLDSGKRLIDLQLDSLIDDHTIEAWITAARTIASSYLTQSKNPRLVDSEGKVCPRLRKWDLQHLNTFRETFRHVFKSQRSEVLWCIEYTLSSITKGKTYIPFRAASDYLRFMQVMLKVVKDGYWQLTLVGNSSSLANTSTWAKFTEVNVMIKTTDSEKGVIGQLKYFTPEKGKGSQRESSRSIHCLLHLAKIMIDAEGLRKALSQSANATQLSPPKPN
ncbi:hypothetical protein [Neptunicella sp.]|uniref:hypothetical protein n=1 Tax=Neptunicella sp. TaxID=2125986 RepID=UPI003F69125F